jgi:hypothetical protein
MRLIQNCAFFSKVMKNSLGVLRHAQDERKEFEMIAKIPFMLRLSKHSVSFFSSLLGRTPKKTLTLRKVRSIKSL